MNIQTLKKDIDFSKYFIPPQITPLYYLPNYNQLTEEQKRRFNQLFALYFNEHFIFFESLFANDFLNALSKLNACKKMENQLHLVLADETRHAQKFYALNLKCAPHYYQNSYFHFINMKKIWLWILKITSQHPELFPIYIWIVKILEERSIFYSKSFLNCPHDLEQSFKDVHIEHMKEEIDHCACDNQLLEILWQKSPRIIRQMNAALFTWLTKEFFLAPRRSILNVTEAWIAEFPDLQIYKNQIKRDLRQLERNNLFVNMMYGPSTIPDSLQKLSKYPEFKEFVKFLDKSISSQ